MLKIMKRAGKEHEDSFVFFSPFNCIEATEKELFEQSEKSLYGCGFSVFKFYVLFHSFSLSVSVSGSKLGRDCLTFIFILPCFTFPEQRIIKITYAEM